MKPNSSRARRWLAVLLAAALFIAACGDDDDTDNAGTDTDQSDVDSGDSTDGGSDNPPDSPVPPSIEELYAGTWGEPPSASPPLVEGARIMHISCAEGLPSCSEPTAFVSETAELMGWTVDVRDANFDPGAAAGFIEEAVAGGYDAITMEAIDCVTVQPALQSARDAGIPVVTFYAHDCTTPGVDGESLMTEAPLSAPWEGQWYQDQRWGASKAEWLVNQLDEVKVITMTQNDLGTPRNIGLGFNDYIDNCDTCEVVANIDFTFAEIGDGTFAQKVAETIAANPDANSLHVLYDGLFLTGAAQAIADAGGIDLLVAGGEFTTANLQFLEQGVEDVIIFYDHKWTAYAALDTVNRLLNDEEPVNNGLGWQAVDTEHPADVENGRFRSPVDYEAAYAALWGLDG